MAGFQIEDLVLGEWLGESKKNGTQQRLTYTLSYMCLKSWPNCTN